MSCRILGRKIEQEFLKIILNELWSAGIKKVIGEYIETKKNKQVESFYSNNGFKEVTDRRCNARYFEYTLTGLLDYNNNYIVEKKDG